MDFYWAYGQRLASEIELPELPSASETPTPNVVVRERELPRRAAELPASARLVYESAESGFSVYETTDTFYWLCDGLGTLKVHDGRFVDVHAADGAPPERVRSLVLGPGLRSLLVQRGWLVFHASAVVIDGVAVAFVGESTAGKSTTAAAVGGRGHVFLADDVTPVFEANDGYAVAPGVATPKLTPAIAQRLEYGPPIGDAVGNERERRYFEAVDVDPSATYPLERIYTLRWTDGVAVRPVDDPLSPLLRGSYPLYDETDTDSFAEHFRRCASLADAVAVRALGRPRSTDAIDDLVSAIESDVRGGTA